MTVAPFLNRWIRSVLKCTVFLLSLLGLRCAGPDPVTMWVIHTFELTHTGFKTFDFALLHGIYFILFQQSTLSFLKVVTVVSKVGRNVTVLKFEDFLHCVIEQLPIVRDDQHCTR